MIRKPFRMILYIVIPIAALTACAKVSEVPPREPISAAEVQRIASAFDTITKANAEAWNEYDFDAMKALYTDDIVFTEATFGDHIDGIDEVMVMARGMSKRFPDMRRRITDHYIGLEVSLCVYDYWNWFGSTEENPFLYVFLYKTRDHKISNWTLYEGSESILKAGYASQDLVDNVNLLLSNYQSAWSSGDSMRVAELYSNDIVRTDTLFQEKQEGQEALTLFIKSFFAWYPDAQWSLLQSFGEWKGKSPIIGGIYSVNVTDSSDQPCEVLVSVLLKASEGKITHESLYYEPDSLIKCGWAK